MVKRILTLIAAIIIVASFTFMRESKAASGNLGCALLANCDGGAACPGKGAVNGCTIACEDRSVIICPPASPE